VVDVDDCINAARYLVAAGAVDPARIAVQGGSAGGYTTLAALAFRDFFSAGVSYFGIGDLTGFDLETHKFESRYTERLVGPLPESRELWVERSPILHVERINAPMLILQGLDDKVVPPSQAEQIVEALRAKGIPYAYLPFAGEGHGFRKAENIRRAYEAELSFYGQVFGFEPADAIEPLQLSRPR
jgi:dipeptidyl aminopeptidase/acylaminoacyl peptidase